MGRKQVIHIDDVIRARKRLEEIADASPTDAPFLDSDGDASWGPVVLCESTTWEDFQRWLNVNEGRIRRWVFEPLADDPGRGRVVIYSLPSAVHETTSKILLRSIIEQIQTIGDRIDLIRTIVDGQPTCEIRRNPKHEPDASLTPTGLTVGGGVLECNNGAPFPNLVLETAYKNDDLDQLRAKLTRWVGPSTSVQVAIGIKIFSQKEMRLRRVALLHQRGQPAQEIEFGEDEHPGAAALALTFPLASIYFGVALPRPFQNLIDPQISIDLIELRAVIDDFLAREQASQLARAQQAREQARAERVARLRDAQVTRPARRARVRARNADA